MIFCPYEFCNITPSSGIAFLCFGAMPSARHPAQCKRHTCVNMEASGWWRCLSLLPSVFETEVSLVELEHTISARLAGQ